MTAENHVQQQQHCELVHSLLHYTRENSDRFFFPVPTVSLLLAAVGLSESRPDLVQVDDFFVDIRDAALPVLIDATKRLADVALDPGSPAELPQVLDFDPAVLEHEFDFRPADATKATRARDLYRVGRHLQAIIGRADFEVVPYDEQIRVLRRFLLGAIAVMQ